MLRRKPRFRHSYIQLLNYIVSSLSIYIYMKTHGINR